MERGDAIVKIFCESTDYNSFINMMREYKAELWEDGSDDDTPDTNVLALRFSIKKSTKNIKTKKNNSRFKWQK